MIETFGVFLAAFPRIGNEHLNAQWLFLGVFLTLFMGHVVFTRYGIRPMLLWVYVVLSGLMSFSGMRYPPTEVGLMLASSAGSGLTFFFLLTLPFLFWLNPIRILNAASFVAVCNSFLIVTQFVLGNDVSVECGIWKNPSLNASFVAVMCPLIWEECRRARKWVRGLVLPVVLGSILMTQALTPVMILASMAGVYALYAAKKKWVPISCATLVALAGVAAAWHFDLSNGRFQIWEDAMQWWVAHSSVLFGSGLGSFKVVSIAALNGGFLFLHNEFLQILFELGAVGFAVVSGFIFHLYRRATLIHAQLLTGVLVFGLTGFPLRHALFCLVVVSILKLRLETISKLTTRRI